MNLNQTIQILSSGICLYAGVMHLFTGLRGESRYRAHLPFATFCFLFFMHSTMAVGYSSGLIVSDKWGPVFSHAAFASMIIFVAAYTGYKKIHVIWALVSAYILVAAAFVLFYHGARAERFLAPFLLLVCAAMCIVPQYRRGERLEAMVLTAASAILLFACLWDTLFLAKHHAPFVAFRQYGFLAFIVIMSLRLSSRVGFAEKQLLESEEKYHHILNNASAVVFIKDLEGKYLFINKKYENLHGISSEKIRGLTDYDLFPQEVADQLRENDRKVIDAGRPLELEELVLHDDGLHTVITTKFPLLNADGNPYAVCGFATDITDRKKAEEALQESEELFRTTFELSASGIVHVRADGSFIRVNQRFCDMVGYSSEELLEMTFQQVSHPDEKESDADRIQQLIDGKSQSYSREKRYVRKDGGVFWGSVTVSVRRNADGKFLYMIGVVQDITERKEAVESALENERKFKLLSDNVRDVIWMMDNENNYLYFSPSIYEFGGMTPEEAMTKSYKEFVAPESQKTVEEYFRKREELEAQGVVEQLSTLELQQIKKDGTLYWVEATVQPMFDEHGKRMGIIGVTRDITDRKKAEQELEQARELLTAAIEASPAGIIIADAPDVTIRHVNSAALGIRGDSDKQLLDIPVEEHSINWELYMPDAVTPYPPEELPLSRAILKGETSTNEEVVMRRHGGEPRWVLVNAAPVRNAAGEVIAGVVVFTDITELKHSQEALLESENRFRQLAELSPFPISILQSCGKYEYINPAFVHVFGYTLDDVPTGGAWFRKSFPDETYRNEAIDAWKKDLEKSDVGEVRPREYRVTCKNGAVKDILFRPVTTQDGKQFITYEDITTRKQYEQALQLTQFTMDNAATEIYWLDKDARVVYANDKASANLEYSHEELWTMSLFDFSTEFPETWEDKWNNVKQKKAVVFESERITKTGKKLPVEVTATHLSYMGREYLCAFVNDITERKKAEATLRESEERMRTVVETMPVLVAAYDDKFNIIAWNAECERITGYSKEDMYDNSEVMELLFPDRDYRERLMKKIEESPESFRNIELALTAKDGSEKTIVWTNLSCSFPIPGWNKWAVGMDVTERKRMEVEQEKLQRQLLQSQKMEAVGQLAGGIAHDFNNMLGVITGYTQLVLGELDEESEFKEDLEQVLEAARRSKDLTMKLLTFARKEKLNVKRVGGEKILKNIVSIMSRSFHKKIEIKSCVDEGLVLNVDENQIHQALMNVCVNARDAMPAGGVLTVEATAVHEEGRLCPICRHPIQGRFCRIQISDTGVGISSDILTKVFEPFFTTKGVGKGTGLGLSTTFGIIHNHGGHINVYSEPNRGTIVKILLPLEQYDSAEQSPGAENEKSFSGTETILVVDDEETMGRMAAKILSKKGYITHTAISGKQAVEVYEEKWREIDLVILDIVMPEMDGTEVIGELKKINPKVKTIISSGYSINGQAADLLDRGAFAFIQKPFMADELYETVRNALDRE